MENAVIILSAIALLGCNSTVKNKPMQADDAIVQKVCDSIPNHVLLDTLLENITKQQNVKMLAELGEKQKNNNYTYSGGGYSFRILLNVNDGNTLFSDGKKNIAFKNYSVLCYQDTNYICNDFGFNSYNSLVAPKIIEVCGMKFLYADMVFPCNGKGCGNVLTMIYDLQEKKPTFLGNYHIPFDGFLLSDFNDDHIPDLLVIAKSYNHEIKGIATPGFNMKLLVYSYDNGTFKLNEDIFYDLHGMGDDEHEKVFSIEKDNWLQKTQNTMNPKIQSLAVLEETEQTATHLVSLVKDERTTKDDYPSLNNGDFFLECEMWDVDKSNESNYTQTCFVLHFIPEKRIEPRTMKEIEHYRIESRLEVFAFYEDGENTGHGEPSGQWDFAGNSDENNMNAKILNYYLAHQSKIQVIKDK